MTSAVELEQRGEVGWLKIKPVQDTIEANIDADDFVEVHLAIALGLEQFRNDDTTRVVVITGQRDGEFHVAPGPPHYDVQAHRDRLNPLTSRPQQTKPNRGVGRALETLALMEIPVIARINGDAIGFGQSIMFGCDIVVAREDAVISDVHMVTAEGVTTHDGQQRGLPWTLTPGDGAMAFSPLFMPPTQLKEYLFLSRAYTAAEMAAMHIVNYAVPLDQLDVVVDDLVGQLLARPAFALARAKRAANKHLITQWNVAADLATHGQSLDFFEHARLGHMSAAGASDVVTPSQPESENS